MTTRTRHAPRGVTTTLFALAALALAAETSRAQDTVYRKSSKTPAVGTITKITPDQIVVERKVGSPYEVPVTDIVRVKWNGEPPGLIKARNAERSGRLTEALEGYAAAIGQAGSNDNLKTDLEFKIARVKAKMGLSDPSKLGDAASALENFKQAHPSNFRFYDTLSYLGEVYLRQKKFAEAKPVFDALKQAQSNDYKLAAENASARLLLLQNDIPGALKAYEAVIAAPAKAPGEVARRHEAMLGKADCLRRQKQFPKAITFLEQVIDEVSPENTSIQANAYVLQGDCLEAMGKTKEALLAYLHVDVLYPSETSLRAEALYHLSQLWKKGGHPQRAAEAAAKLQSEYPNSPWTKKLSGEGA